MSGATTSSRTSVRVLSIIFATTGMLALALPAWAPPQLKAFNVCGGVAPACASPASVPIGTATPFTIQITSIQRAGQTLGSANVSLPAELAIVGGPSDPVVPGGKDWTAALSGQTIELRSSAGNALASGESVTVTVSVDSPCVPPRAPIGVVAKSSVDFTTGTLVGDNLPYVIGCTPPVAHHLAFGQQPSDFLAGQEMAPAVTVRVEDASNNLVTDFAGTIALAFGSNPDGSVLFNAGPFAVSGGIATFPNLGVNKPTLGTTSGYTLVASSSPATTSVTSTPFAITGMSDICELETCTANTGNLNAGTPADNWIGRVTLDAGECNDTSCYLTAYEVADCPEEFTCKTNLFVFIPPSNQTGLTTVQITCDTSICPNVGPPGNGEPVYKLLDNGQVVVLDRCHNSPPSGEDLTFGCITEIIRTRPGDTVFTIVLPEGDPAIFK